jgi:hypothetical protein
LNFTTPSPCHLRYDFDIRLDFAEAALIFKTRTCSPPSQATREGPGMST